MASKGFLKAGKREGPFEDFFENGQLERKGSFKDDLLDGSFEEFMKKDNERKSTYKAEKMELWRSSMKMDS